ncbi:electron transport complex subunit RsxG [Granulosicoccus sp. 3-233]|uniref:electron transport complex subunit RsxG n=1 Tax=Granulosicoccus sp. 3-233 TaxID=3417969 RepID=UPI003D33C40C
MRIPARTGLTLACCAALAIISLSLVHQMTRERLEAARQQWLLQGLSAVLPEGPYDEDPLSSRRMITAPELGSTQALPLYTVYRDRQPLAAVLSVIAPDGYNGDIRLLLGVRPDGQIIGARVTEHRETPGLGDDIEIIRSDWITQFAGRSLQHDTASAWAVTRFGGHFDSLTGATITPQAVITAIHRALQWYQQHRDEVFSS